MQPFQNLIVTIETTIFKLLKNVKYKILNATTTLVLSPSNRRYLRGTKLLKENVLIL